MLAKIILYPYSFRIFSMFSKNRVYVCHEQSEQPSSLNKKKMTTKHIIYKHTSYNGLRNVKEFTEHILYPSQDMSHAKHQVTATTNHTPIISAIIATQSQTRLQCFIAGLTYVKNVCLQLQYTLLLFSQCDEDCLRHTTCDCIKKPMH